MITGTTAPARRLGRVARVLALVAIAACASSSPRLRRRLVTDKVALGTDTRVVVWWLQAHGWCIDRSQGEWPIPHWPTPGWSTRRQVRAEVCARTRPWVQAVLTFQAGVLVQADVHYDPGSRRPATYQRFAELAFELETRYGAPVDDGGWNPRLTWVTDGERIILYVEQNRASIVERHLPAPDLEAAPPP